MDRKDRRRITPGQRFHGANRCPHCQGADDDPRGQGMRCIGFTCDDDIAFFCTREDAEHGPQDPIELAGMEGVPHWRHVLDGPCLCGATDHRNGVNDATGISGHAQRPAQQARGTRPNELPPPQPAEQPAEQRSQTPDHQRGQAGTTIYPYHDADERLVFEVVRFERWNNSKREKTFTQRRPARPDDRPEDVDKDGYVWNLQGVARVPFGLPELMDAAPSDVVYIVEGEQCVQALRAHHLVATCNAGGAGKWTAAESRWLRGRFVVVAPDNDAPGIRHAHSVLKSLHGVAADVLALDPLPGVGEGGDIVDYLASGKTIDDFLELVAERRRERDAYRRGAGGWQPEVQTAAELDAQELPPARWVVPGLITEGITLVADKPKKGKTVLNLNIALDIALGEPVLSHFEVPTPVEALYLALEESPRRMKRRLRQMLGPDGQAPVGLRLCYKWPALADGAVEELERYLEAHPAIGVVFIDTLTALLGPEAGARKGYLAEYHALRPLFELARRRAIAIIVIYHTRKTEAPAGDPLDAINATNGLSAAVDNCLILARVSGVTQMARVGRDYDDEDTTLALTRNKERLRWVYEGPADQVRMAQSQQAILQALEKSVTRLTPKQIAQVTGLSEGTVRGTVRRMVDSGALDAPTGRGLYGYPGREYATEAVEPAKVLDALRESPTRLTIKQLADALRQPESAVLIAVLKLVREKVLREPNAQGEVGYPGKQYGDDDSDDDGDDATTTGA